MKLSKAQYSQLSLFGRVKLLHQYARFICSKILETKKIMIFKLYDFFVAVIKDLHKNKIIEADPILSQDMLKFYLLL